LSSFLKDRLRFSGAYYRDIEKAVNKKQSFFLFFFTFFTFTILLAVKSNSLIVLSSFIGFFYWFLCANDVFLFHA